MLYIDAEIQAKAEAKKNNVNIAIVRAPSEVTLEQDGPYDYCAQDGVSMLYPHSTIVALVKPNGDVSAMSL